MMVYHIMLKKGGGVVRRFLLIFCLIVALTGLFVTAQASEASEVVAMSTVYPDGTSQTTLTVVLHTDEAGELSFPVPAEATAVTLNGSRVRAPLKGNARQIDLSGITGGMAGTATVTVTYSLPNQVQTTQTGSKQLQLPLLAGFIYPVQKLQFTVNFPGNLTTEPAFSSGYHMAGIEEDLSFHVNGASITGVSVNALKDHETLMLLLPVDDAMFSQIGENVKQISGDDWGIAICCVLALLYWLLTLRFLPPFSKKTPMVPEGFTAGEMSSALTLTGANLATMILSWAQMGYVFIQLARYDRVLLHKRMDMGNERDEGERKRFAALFAKRDLVDCTSGFYAIQCKKAETARVFTRNLATARSGNPLIFRGLCALAGLFGGLSFALALSNSIVGKWLLGIVLIPAGAISCWYMLDWAGCLLLREKGKFRRWLILAAVWLAMGLLAGQWHMVLTIWFITLLGGLMFKFGGRRTETGRQVFGQVTGLRRYLKTVSQTNLERICKEDPDYFFSMAPYAMALGVDKRFARQFGSRRIDRCPYLTTGMDGHRTAKEWNELVCRTLEIMEGPSRISLIEKLRRAFGK